MTLTILRKMWNKKAMMLFLFLGNLLFIGIAAANPVFLDAALKRTLFTSIASLEEQQGCWPMTYSVTPANNYKPQTIQHTTEELLASAEAFDLPLYDLITVYSLKKDETTSNLDREDRTSSLFVSTVTGLRDHIEILSGTNMSTSPDQEHIIDGIVSQRAYRKCGFLLGEVLTFEKLELSPGIPLKIRIAGVFRNNREKDAFWVNAPERYAQNLFIDDTLYHSLFLSETSACKSKPAWYALYDYSALRLDSIPSVLTQISNFDALFQAEYGNNHVCSFTNIYKEFLITKRNTEVTFRIFQIPFFLLLLSFILMVSRRLLQMEMTEIAVYKSRGVSKKQIILMYLIQSLLITSSAAVFAIPFSMFLVKLLGSATGFLSFSETGTFYPVFSAEALLYILAACSLSVLIMLSPVISQSGTTIVRHRAGKYRKKSAAFWQKYFLDLILLCISFYGLFHYLNQKDALLSGILSGKPLDPLPFVCSSLFLLGSSLLVFRLTTCLIRLIFRLFKKGWPPALYASFTYILKTRKQQTYFAVFLFLTMALGVFNSSAARTINSNDEQNIRYLIGTDLVVCEKWQSNGDSQDVQENGAPLIYQEPDFSKYAGFEHVLRTAKVYRDNNMNVKLSSGNLNNVQLMGIHTKDFGETARFDTSLLPEHWYNYLNLLAGDPSGFLLSSDFEQKYNVKAGDTLVVKKQDGSSLSGTVLGFVDYWPGYAPSWYEISSEGSLNPVRNHLVVAGLSAVQNAFGVLPYEVWIRTDGDSAGVYEGISNLKIQTLSLQDTAKLLENRKNDAYINSTNGILTLGFLISIILCGAGFLIYWTLSIKERELQFGFFRAMGMEMYEITEMLITEQCCLSLLPILSGALFGWLAARLYMPLIQMVYSSADYVIPLNVVFSAEDNLRLGAALVVVFGSCMGILMRMIRSMKISQALRLGED